MSDVDLDRLERLHQAVPQVPWAGSSAFRPNYITDPDPAMWVSRVSWTDPSFSRNLADCFGFGDEGYEKACALSDYIAASHNALPDLITELARRRARDAATAALADAVRARYDGQQLIREVEAIRKEWCWLQEDYWNYAVEMCYEVIAETREEVKRHDRDALAALASLDALPPVTP